MSFYFWLAMLTMLLVAIIILVVPLLRSGKALSFAYRESNLRLHEEKFKELDLDLSEGRIDPAQYKLARQELDRELLGDIPEESKDTAALHYGVEQIKKPAIALTIAVFMPTLAFLVYMQLGMHAASEKPVAESKAQASTQASVAEMTTKLEKRLRSDGGDVKEWVMLGRAYKHLGRYEEAANAFATAGNVEPDAQIMLEQAETLALKNENRFDVKARELVLDALGLEPNNVNALWFAGVVEYQFGNYQNTIDHLSRLSSQAATDKEVNKSVRFYLTKAREQLVAAGKQVPAIDEIMQVDLAVAETTAKSNAEMDSKSVVGIQVQVDVDDKVRQQFSANDAVFVYAKAVKGPRMPLAVQRMTLGQLPTTVLLDDSMAMIEGMNISAFPSVVVSARISKSGSAIAQSGDYIGKATVNTSSPGKLNIKIDTPVP
jgi:cytochrome c-type biogenesis protein CcmH